MKQISVIILNWNGTKLLREYLPSVVKYTNKDIADVIVADNGSTDESLDVLNKEFPEVNVIKLSKNYGFAHGYNLAIANIDTKYIVLLNDDVRVTEGWLEPLYEYMEANPKTGAVQPKLLSDRDKEMFEYAGAAGGFLDKNGYPFCRGRIFDTIEKDEGQYDQPTKVMWATGACLMVRTDTFYKAGNLDENFFAHMEEIDLCWRMRNIGYDIVYLPTSKVYHLGGGSLAVGNPRKTKLNFRNSILMLYKNLPLNKRSKVICTRKWLDAIAAINFLLHFQFSHVAAVCKAHCEASRMIRELYAPTMRYLDKPKLGEKFREESINIISQYYLKGRKLYSKL